MADLILRDCDPDELRRQIVADLAGEIRKIAEAQSAPRLVDRPTMAELASIGTATLDNEVSNDRIPSVLVGRRRLFDPAAVIAALSKGGA